MTVQGRIKAEQSPNKARIRSVWIGHGVPFKRQRTVKRILIRGPKSKTRGKACGEVCGEVPEWERWSKWLGRGNFWNMEGRKKETAAQLVPQYPTLDSLEKAAAGCHACPLWKRGTQNVVKHFKWEPVGKRRIHKKPNAREIAACRPWLEAELAVLKPQVVVCMGATAAQALLGREFRVSQKHGQFVESPLAPHVIATVHPSSILRAPDEEARRSARAQFVQDLKRVAEVIDR